MIFNILLHFKNRNAKAQFNNPKPKIKTISKSTFLIKSSIEAIGNARRIYKMKKPI